VRRPARPTPVRLGGFLAGLLVVLALAPAVSSAPVTTLSNGTVAPTSGTTATTFNFSVDFSGAAGERKGFETVGGTPPLSASQCVATVGFAQDTGF